MPKHTGEESDPLLWALEAHPRPTQFKVPRVYIAAGDGIEPPHEAPSKASALPIKQYPANDGFQPTKTIKKHLRFLQEL